MICATITTNRVRLAGKRKALTSLAIRQQDRAARAAALGFVLAVILEGCGVAAAPLEQTPQVVATPQRGQVLVSNQAQAAVGDVVPVYVSVANGTSIPRYVVPSQVFAVNDAGERVAPLAPAEAARRAGNSEELSAALKSAAVSGVAAGAIGTGLGAAAGAALGDTTGGVGLGAAIGAGEGILYGAPAGQGKADEQADQQIGALALAGGPVRENFTVSGYVFFPKGHYKGVDVLLVDGETGDTDVMTQPWR